jgi:hypothetical protein
VLRAESAGCAFTNGLPTISLSGAMGLMQLMPGTWEGLKNELQLGEDPFDPHDNIVAGARYLRELYDQFGLTGATTAYHTGPGRYAQHLLTGEALRDSTVVYISRVLADLNAGSANELIVARQSNGLESASSIHKVFIRTAESSVSHRLFISLKHPRIAPEISPSHSDGVPDETHASSLYPNEEPPDPEAR